MARKKLPVQENPSPELLKFREKRKWQISLRRYVLDGNICIAYAPYFGLDIKNMRNWFECQFMDGASWDNFGQKWQFDHIIPVAYFDFADENELKACWNFTNIRVDLIQSNKNKGNRLDVLAAKRYFRELYEQTKYKPCLKLLEKIDKIELSAFVGTEMQQQFIKEHYGYLEMIENYSAFEFELLNSGRSIEEVNKEISLFSPDK